MEGILGSAVVQEAISRVSSVIFSKHDEKASRKHNIERLEMAHTELELAMERSGKLPITDVSLLRRRKILKRAFEECGDVLHRCKQQAQEDEEIERGLAPTDSSFPKRIARATKSSIAYLLTMGKDDLSCSDVGSTSIMTHRQPPLEVTVGYVPHIKNEVQQESYATEIVGDNEERIDDVSMQQVAETAKSNAINCFSSQPELTGYGMLWKSKHGGAGFMVQKQSFERARAPKTQCWYLNRIKGSKRR
ncbi:hypothetical protein C2845_PM18G05950 [Panicum miliaceum]|uniref:Uncharacterized protein n=1 Tax=Panicum miliaceum TaxID=4540 RepID=A0A3L6PJ00_PANMI|nr:hypothetical protein C2845_PM18G05950 [Panicum miliaceum]